MKLHGIPTLSLATLAALAALVLLGGCEKKNKEENPPEFITTVTLTLVDTAGVMPTVTASYLDPDGEGGSPYTRFDTIRLAANTTYHNSFFILDETKSPPDTTSNEIFEERDDHLFFFTPTGANIQVSYLDMDDNGFPVGLQSRWVTGSASTGTMHIVLRHQPGVKDGTYTPGESDIDLTFQTVVQ